MPSDVVGHFVELARRIVETSDVGSGPVWEEFCNTVEAALRDRLAEDASWPRHEWLDGFVATSMQRDPSHLTVQGVMWVNATRPEPCEVEIGHTGESEGLVILRFQDARGPSRASAMWQVRFPARGWRFELQL